MAFKLKKPLLDRTIDRALQDAECYAPESEEYSKIIDNVGKLAEAKAQLKANRKSLDPNTVLQAIATVALVLVSLYYEETRCITGKAWSWIRKLW